MTHDDDRAMMAAMFPAAMPATVMTHDDGGVGAMGRACADAKLDVLSGSRGDGGERYSSRRRAGESKHFHGSLLNKKKRGRRYSFRLEVNAHKPQSFRALLDYTGMNLR
jgi:hypothetical protein